MRFTHFLAVVVLLLTQVSFVSARPIFIPPTPGAVTAIPEYSGTIDGQEAGYLKVNSTDAGEAAYLFYWFVEKKHPQLTLQL